MNNLQNHQAERIIIAGLIRNPEELWIKLQAENISTAHFTDARCQQIYPHIERLCLAGNTYLAQDIAMSPEVMAICRTDEHFAHDLADITSSYSGKSHWESYLPSLKTAKATRVAYRAAQEAMHAIEQGQCPDELAEILRDGGETTMLTMESKTAWKSGMESTLEFVTEFEDLRKDQTPGIITGIEELDSMTGGMRPGELWVVCGETSAGKSVAALQFGASAIQHGKQVALFSLEMGAGENVARIISNTYDIHFGTLRNPREKRFDSDTGKWVGLTTRDVNRIKTATSKMKDSSLRIVDEGGLTIERIEAICSEMVEREPLDLIIIDYVQLVGTTRKGFATHEELGWLVGRMKQLAKKFHCPVVTASQLNDDGKLAQSRAIGHHADVVLRIEGEKGLHFLKNRNGQRFVHVNVELDGTKQRFAPKSTAQY